MSSSLDDGSRIQVVDFLKGVAVVAMIQVHLTELFAIAGWQESLAGRISLFAGGPAAAPLFMVMMGYVAAQGRRSAKYFLQRGMKLLLWGLLLNIGLNAHLLLKISFSQWPQNPLHFLFGVDILFLAGLSLLLLALATSAGRFSPLAAVLMFAGILYATSLPAWPGQNEDLMTYLMAFVHSEAPWSYFPVVPWAAYPLAGFCLASFHDKLSAIKLTDTHLALAALGGLLFLGITSDTGWNAATDLSLWYHHPAAVVGWNLIFVATATMLASLFLRAFGHGPVAQWLCFAGKRVTAFYVFQWLIIGNLATWLYQTQYPLQLLLWFVVVTGASYGLTILWYRFRKTIFAAQHPKN
ncbi:MAG: DUF1624 domain-containing protein [Bacteroidetes bacterium]|nr:DUF1624 domain-containing protein [Bacteroidota bacterium]